jgi:hypothetical protein
VTDFHNLSAVTKDKSEILFHYYLKTNPENWKDNWDRFRAKHVPGDEQPLSVRFSIGTAAREPASRRAASNQLIQSANRPLLATIIPSLQRGSIPLPAGSFFTLTPTQVHVFAVDRERDDILLFTQEIAGTSCRASLSSTFFALPSQVSVVAADGSLRSRTSATAIPYRGNEVKILRLSPGR